MGCYTKSGIDVGLNEKWDWCGMTRGLDLFRSEIVEINDYALTIRV